MAGETTSKTWTYDKDNKKFQEQNPDVPPVVDDEQQKLSLSKKRETNDCMAKIGRSLI